ncbi:MAG: hypothetical protein RBT63_05975 [Bdellovibrionales bacterium]|jgi:hypothetical protein|nr:hypothetical protein [Bdellovibrionales bacterium]
MNAMLKIVRLNKTFLQTLLVVGAVGFVGPLGAQTAGAAPMKVLIANGTSISPETGAREMKFMNPSGEAQFSFTESGFKLEFVGQNGSAREIKVHFDRQFSLAEPQDAQEARFNQLLAEALYERGAALSATLAKVMADKTVESGSVLVMKLEGKQFGFLKSDYNAQDVEFLGNKGSLGNLGNLVVYHFSEEANERMRVEAEAEAARAAAAAKVNKKPALPRLTPIARACRMMFASAP